MQYKLIKRDPIYLELHYERCHVCKKFKCEYIFRIVVYTPPEHNKWNPAYYVCSEKCGIAFALYGEE